MKTLDTMYSTNKKYRPALSPTSFYQPDLYSRVATLRPQSEYAFGGVGAGAGVPTLMYSTRGASSARSMPIARPRRARCCSAALAVAAALAALTVLAVAALAFYMGALRTDNNDPIIAFECRMRVSRGDVYSASLSRVGGAAWKERARRYASALRAVYAAAGDSSGGKRAAVAAAFAGAQVTGFGEGQLDVHFRLYLDRRKLPSSVSNIEDSLKDIIVQDMLSRKPLFGQIKVDPSSIVIERDRNHTYHSENLAQEQPAEPAPTPVQQNTSPAPQFNAKERTVHTRMGVVRKTTVKPTQPSSHRKKTPFPSDEPEINTDNLPVIQGTFQITKTEADITENKKKAEMNRTTDKPPLTTIGEIVADKQTNPQSNQTLTSKLPTPTNTVETSTIPSTMATKRISELLNPEVLIRDNPPKKLPEIDSLFSVSPIIDDEPWKPIEPDSIYSAYRSTTQKTTVEPIEPMVLNAEERMGEVEVVDDISALVSETINEDLPPDWSSSIFTNGHYSKDTVNNFQSNGPSRVVYTSFTDPAFSSTFAETETLGNNYPKPYPIPVDKIRSDSAEIKPTTPKDKFSSVSINVVRPGIHLDTEEFVRLNGGIIAKRHNITDELTSEEAASVTEIDNTNDDEANHRIYNRNREQMNSFKYQPTWQFINGTDLNQKETNRKSPGKIFNETLQAVVIKNEEPVDRPPLKLSNRVTIIRNISSIFNQLASTLGFDPQPLYKILNKNILGNQTSAVSAVNNTASVEEESDEEKDNYDDGNPTEESEKNEVPSTTDVPNKVVTLLPAKSNSGVNRPLRPRPSHLKKTSDPYEERGFTDPPLTDHVMEFMDNLNGDEGGEEKNIEATVAENNKTTTAIVGETTDIPQNQNKSASMPKNIRISSPPIQTFDKSEKDSEKKNQDIPEGAYKVEVHVSSSISTSIGRGPNKTLIEITSNNGSNINDNHAIVDRLTAEKLRHLASLATITDFNNNTFFNPGSDPEETVISTKAVSSNYNINHAGFKILTKTFNKVTNDIKNEEKRFNNFYVENKKAGNESQAMNTTEGNCEESSFRCSSGQCLLSTARCNRLLDCPNGEDETGCTCADYLRSESLLRKICDGIVDCWDFSDENNCDWCEPGQYVCSNTRQCIEKKQVCDGKKDCPQGDDERLCVTVALSEQAASSLPYSNEGYLMVQKNGRWGRLCVQNFDEVILKSRSTLQVSDLGRAVCRAMTYNDYKNIKRVAEKPVVEEEGNYYELKYNSRPTPTQTSLTFSPSTCDKGEILRVSCSSLECGVRPQAVNQQASGGVVRRYRIVGGGNAGAGAWPWQAALYKEGDFQCGGTLVSDRWLVSAGHCFYRASEDYWVARLGALRRGTSFLSPYEQLRPLDSINLHPGYVDSGFINDIALLRTRESVHFSDYVRPICLPPATADIEDGRTCTVIGWGQLFEVGRIFPDTLQEVQLPIISTGECRKRTLFLPLYRVTDDMFCAGYDRGGRDACLGDSGGPLMCQDNDNHWYLYGVTSNGYGCARANRPGVYTKVTNYMTWIDATMRLHDDKENGRKFPDEPPGNVTTLLDLETAETAYRGKAIINSCKGHRCPLGECLPPSQICNGFLECGDGSDEADCKR